jgi:hypothetical protein
MYCLIKCVKTERMLKGNFASSVFHSCNAKTQICVTGPQCVKWEINAIHIRTFVYYAIHLQNVPFIMSLNHTESLHLLGNLRHLKTLPLNMTR